MTGKRRAGRPTTAPKEREKATLGIRASADLKRRINEAAETNGRSLSQEAEVRLENSFRGERYLDDAMDLAYGPRGAVFLAAIGRALREVDRHSGPVIDWMDDAYMFNDLVGAIDVIVETFRPADVPLPEAPPLVGCAIGQNVGRAIKDPENSPWNGWGRPLNAKLGAAAAKLNVASHGVSTETIEPIRRWRIRR
jgi:hypothetical protein